MKTVTEFSGFSLKDLLTLRGELFQQKRTQSTSTPITAEQMEVKAPDDAKAVATEATADAAPQETTAETAAPTEDTSTSPAKAQVTRDKKRGGKGVRPKGPRIEISHEELLTAIKERQPDLSDERLEWLTNAVEAVDHRRESDVKRVVVLELAEGERAPTQARTTGSHVFIAEYFPSLNPPKKKDRPRGARGKGKGKRGRDRNKKRDGGRRPQTGRRGDASSGGPRSAQA